MNEKMSKKRRQADGGGYGRVLWICQRNPHKEERIEDMMTEAVRLRYVDCHDDMCMVPLIS